MAAQDHSQRRYGRSEHAPIVIDMVDYDNQDDYEDEFSYSFSSPRHAVAGTGVRAASPRYASESRNYSHHTSTLLSSNRSSPRHTASGRSPRQQHITSNSSVHSATNPHQSMHMQNFAQRRSFMMGGLDKMTEEYTTPNPTPRHGYYAHHDANEYRQSPESPRNFHPSNESADTRDRPVTDTANHRRNGGRGGGIPSSRRHDQNRHDHFHEDASIYSTQSVGGSQRIDNIQLHNQHHQYQYRQSPREATIPVFAQGKNSDKQSSSIFTFEDDELHTVRSVMNRPAPSMETSAFTRDSQSVTAPPTSEKKVFYFDIDDLNSRLLRGGNQDLGLHKKKAKNTRNRISRNRAKRKSKKSIFNFSFDESAGKDGAARPNKSTTGRDSQVPSITGREDGSIHRGARFDSKKSTHETNGLYIDTSPEVGRAYSQDNKPARNAGSPHEETTPKLLPISPVGTTRPDYKLEVLPPKTIMDNDADSIREKSARNKTKSPTEISNAKKDIEDAASTVGSPSSQIRMVATFPRTNGGANKDEEDTRTRSDSTELRATQVYDKISNRLDNIVSRDKDIGNRQRAIRAVFEEVQQHVEELRKQKSPTNQPANAEDEAKKDTKDKAKLKEVQQEHLSPKQSLISPKQSLISPKQSLISPTQSLISPKQSLISPTQSIASPKQSLISPTQSIASPAHSFAEHPTSPNQRVVYLDLSAEEPKTQELDTLENFSIDSDGSKSQNTRPNAYLSSDNSGDDEVVVQKQSTHIEEAESTEHEVHVVEEEEEENSKGNLTGEVATSPRPSLSDIERLDSLVSRVLSGDKGVQSGEGNDTDADPRGQEDRLDPDGDRLEANPTKEAENSDEDDSDSVAVPGSRSGLGSDDVGRRSGFLESRSNLGSQSMNATQQPTPSAVKSIDGNILDVEDRDEEDAAKLSIDREFDRVVPFKDNESDTNVNYDINETLDRVARQSELEKQKDFRAMSRQDEEEKANALLDGVTRVMSQQTEDEGAAIALLNTLSSNSRYSRKPATESQISEFDKPRKNEPTAIYVERKSALSYDANLAISAATKSSASTSASDLEEFPIASVSAERHDERHNSDDSSVSSSSSNISSSGMSESTSESLSETSYDSFISNADESDAESDMEFFETNQGFAENFMSNLITKTFGWFEKQQETLACGFKSSEVDSPSLLQTSLARKNDKDPQLVKEKRNKAMKGLRNAVTSKYGRENVPGAASEKKHRSSSGKSSRRHQHEDEDRKQSKRTAPRQASSKQGVIKTSAKPSGRKVSSREDRQERERSSTSEKAKQRDAVSRKKISTTGGRKELYTRARHVVEEGKSNTVNVKSSSKKSNKMTTSLVVSATASSESITDIKVSNEETGSKPQPGVASDANINKDVTSPTKGRSGNSTSEKWKHPFSEDSVSSERSTFDFIKAIEDEDAGSVQVIAVSHSKTENDEMKGEKSKKSDSHPQNDGDSVHVVSNPEFNSGAGEILKVEEKYSGPIRSPREEAKLDITFVDEAVKPNSKGKKSSRKDNDQGQIVTESTPKESESAEEQKRRAKSPDSEPTVFSVSPPLRRPVSPPPHRPPTTEVKMFNHPSSIVTSPLGGESDGLEHTFGQTLKKKKKKTVKKENETLKPTKRSTSRSRHKKAAVKSSKRGDDEKSESDCDSINSMLTEEEREIARKERRRSAALKRRRKLRERRRAKLEENITDDTLR